jgi:surface polysaccharide O-acyltransferase-like enzyme
VPFGYGKPVGHELDLVLIINQISRFAVPFFLVISGYFWSTKISSGGSIFDPSLKSAKRIGTIFILWSIIYLAISSARSLVNGGLNALWSDFLYAINSVASSPITSLLQGGKPHLWFLTALLISMLISAVLLAKGRLCFLILLAVSLYVTGLLGGAYSRSPLGINVPFDFRNGPFLGLIFFVSGHLLHLVGPKRSWALLGASLTLVGLAGQFTELNILHDRWGTTMWQDYVGSTLFLGIGVAMMALSNHPLLCLQSISRVGPLVLGIYAVHYFFVDVFRSRHGFTVIPWLNEILYILAVLLLSTISVWALSRFKPTERLVT